MWVSFVNGTPKMSQIGPLIYGITQMDYDPYLLKMLLLWFLKLLSTHPIHIVVRGNFPFNCCSVNYAREHNFD